MRWKSNRAGMAVFLVGAFLLLSVPGDAQSLSRREFMRLKLEHSQKILEGLVTEDYEVMAQHAQKLSLLSLDASWQVLQTTEYAQESVEFRRAADALTAAAKRKNPDSAALAYVNVTMKCVQCHRYLRDTRAAASGK